MSVEMTNRIWVDRTLTSYHELLVMLALAHYHTSERGCFPSLAALMHKTRMSKVGVLRILDRLEQKGYLKIVRGRGRSNRNQYILYPETEHKTLTSEADSVIPVTFYHSKEKVTLGNLLSQQRKGNPG